jgi:hypothetical protein
MDRDVKSHTPAEIVRRLDAAQGIRFVMELNQRAQQNLHLKTELTRALQRDLRCVYGCQGLMGEYEQNVQQGRIQPISVLRAIRSSAKASSRLHPATLKWVWSAVHAHVCEHWPHTKHTRQSASSAWHHWNELLSISFEVENLTDWLTRQLIQQCNQNQMEAVRLRFHRTYAPFIYKSGYWTKLTSK